MAITITEIITVDEYIEIYPQDTNIEEDIISSAINRATITLDAICGGMIAKVWGVTETTDPLYRTEQEHQYIKQAHAIQAQYYVSRNLDMSAGSESYTSGSNNYNETRSRPDLVVDETIYQLLAQARVYNPNITTNTTIKNVGGVQDGFYDPSYDPLDNYVTYNVGDLRYVMANHTTGTNKFLYNNNDGNIEYVEIKLSPTGTSSATANFITINGVEWALGGAAGGAIWGNIQGTITDQTDLVEYFTTRLSGYATEQWVEDKHYLTEHQSLAGYATENWVNSQGFLKEHQSLENYYTKGETNQLLSNKQDIINKYCNDATVSDNTLTINFSNGDSTSFTPTSQPGGITDVQVTDTQGTASVVTGGVATIDLTGYATTTNVNEQLATKQDTLVSGTNIKTINGNTILGSGDLSIQGVSIIEKTWSELKTLRDNSQLTAGQWYRITDYVATTTQSNTQATTNQYDIIVLATSTNTLSEQARAIQHSGDTYFANSNLSAWKVWYCLDNDTNRFAWASTSGKGVVYHLIDEYQNNVWYDFKLIQVKNTNSSDRFYYLFDSGTTDPVDASLSASTAFASVYSNDLGFYISSNKYQIGCNVFKGTIFYNNTIGNSFYSNTIGNNFSHNTIGNYFYSNTIGNNFYSNTIGNAFNSNTIGNNFNYNTIGNRFYNNTIGNSFNQNTIGNVFYYNTIGTSTTDIYWNNNHFGNGIICVDITDYGTSSSDTKSGITIPSNYKGTSSSRKTLSSVNNNTTYYLNTAQLN